MQIVAVATRPMPAFLPARTFHVVPGTAGGSGSAADPFRGVPAAEAVAQPGDVFLAHAGISFQPQNGSPWYILGNQLVGFMEARFKFRTTDRSVIAHNTIVMWSKMICCNDAHLLRAIVKNNLWITVAGGQIWEFASAVKDWRTDFNNDGFDWATSTAPFRYGGVVYSSLAGFAAASGLETNPRQINHATCFATFTYPGLRPCRSRRSS